MRYKTMVMELLEEQYPTLQHRLTRERMMLRAVETYAEVLKRSHEAWIQRLTAHKPRTDPNQIASEALELALAELQADLPSESQANGPAETAISLDAAMAFIKRHTPPA
jgi:hypothetical protein